MDRDCDHRCEDCGRDCGQKTDATLKAPLNRHSRIRRVIGVVSGKGGVGKSAVTSLLAVAMRRRGHAVGILDADITGPSIPRIFGILERAAGTGEGILPALSREGIRIMSANLLLETDTDPVVWRGPLIAGTVKSFWTEVLWGELDFLFIDLPPGTGDVPLTVFQSIPVDGIVVVTSPQELVSMIVAKAIRMAGMMGVPVLGLVENLAFFRCPDSGREYPVFGQGHAREEAARHGLPLLARLPLDPGLAQACDRGELEAYTGISLGGLEQVLEGRGEEKAG